MSQSAAQTPAAPAPATRWIAVGCALAVWLLGLLAASPQLHGALHSEAGHADHTCAVTLFSQGVETASVGHDLVAAPALFQIGACALPPALPVSLSHHRLPPVCGPPRR